MLEVRRKDVKCLKQKKINDVTVFSGLPIRIVTPPCVWCGNCEGRTMCSGVACCSLRVWSFERLLVAEDDAVLRTITYVIPSQAALSCCLRGASRGSRFRHCRFFCLLHLNTMRACCIFFILHCIVMFSRVSPTNLHGTLRISLLPFGNRHALRELSFGLSSAFFVQLASPQFVSVNVGHIPHTAPTAAHTSAKLPVDTFAGIVLVCFFFVHTLVWFFMCYVDGTHVKHIFPCEHVEKKNKDHDEEEQGKKEEKEEQIRSKARDT